jgi:ATP-dependent helicase HepA
MLFRFLHEGLDAFETSLPGAPAFSELGAKLMGLAAAHAEKGTRAPLEELDEFLDECRRVRERVVAELASGRDRLLELGSSRPRDAESLLAEIRKWDEDEALDAFVSDALDSLGVDLERTSARSFVFRQGTKLTVSSLPGLRADEVGMTSDRTRATREEKLDFLTWDHPMVIGVFDLLLGSPRGSVAVALLPGGERGILLEAIFVLETLAPAGLDLSRFLPPTPIRVVVDHRLADATGKFPPSALEGRLRDGRKELRFRDRSILERLPPRMLKALARRAEGCVRQIVARRLEEAHERLGAEVQRLRSLAEVNNHVALGEVSEADARRKRIEKAIKDAEVRLDSLRLISLGFDPSLV